MYFIRAIDRDRETPQIFNLERVLHIEPQTGGITKILMGAGLYWFVYTDSISLLDSPNEILNTIKEGF